jgi:hypothetical protein
MTFGFLNLIWNGLSRRCSCLVDGMVSRQASICADRAVAGDIEGRVLAGVWVRVRVWWWPGGSWGGTTRRVRMDRLAAKLIFADWDRTSARRRKVPLTTVAWQ